MRKAEMKYNPRQEQFIDMKYILRLSQKALLILVFIAGFYGVSISQTETKQLYLSETNNLDRIDPVASSDATLSVDTLRQKGGLQAFEDNFGAQAYSNSDSSLTWGTDWIETDNNGGGATGGNIYVTTGGILSIKTDGTNIIERSADISGAISGNIYLDIIDNGLTNNGGIIEFEYYDGSIWTSILTVNSNTLTDHKYDIQ